MGRKYRYSVNKQLSCGGFKLVSHTDDKEEAIKEARRLALVHRGVKYKVYDDMYLVSIAQGWRPLPRRKSWWENLRSWLFGRSS
jgi:hypothetical protein